MMEKAEITVHCDHCDTDNKLTAVGYLNDEPIRCSHCGQPLGKISELTEQTKPPETIERADRTQG
jgi:hypothetical protein